MIFHFTNCNNDFDAALQPRRCPDCGSTNLRLATEEEWAEHLRKMGLAISEKWDYMTEIDK